MDWSFLYGSDGYYFIQGFWLDIKLLIAHVNPITVIVCFIVLLAILLYIERKRIRIGSILFAIISASYVTFLLTVTIFGRTGGNISSWQQILITYERALSGEYGSQLDILYNIVLYIPVGLLISHYKNIKIDIAVLAVMPTVIELTQLITTRGVFELTDIINNFIGGMIGLGIAKGLGKIIKLINDKRKGGKVERAE